MCEHRLECRWHEDVRNMVNAENIKGTAFWWATMALSGSQSYVAHVSAWHKQVAPADHDSVC